MAKSGSQEPTPSPYATIEGHYRAHLTEDRGLSARTVSIYGGFVGTFLSDLRSGFNGCTPSALSALVVRSVLFERAQILGASSESARLFATAVRSFLRFLFLRGETASDLSVSIPRFQKWRHATVPLGLSPKEVDRALAAPDRRTPTGRRDYAILLLLARLGLRAGEVVALELDDIDWRGATIAVTGKTRRGNRLPLVREVGQALAGYIRHGRGRSACRRVFLRRTEPNGGLSGPASIGHVVRGALKRAGVTPMSRGAAHLFRHSLATGMLRRGASLPEIAEVLRHRSISSTAIYAKVDIDTLRGVALPWPRNGSAR